MGSPILYGVTFVDLAKRRLVIAADKTPHTRDSAQMQLETGKIWDNSEPCDGTQDWYAYPLADAVRKKGVS
jgi:hypothetical protein